MLLTVIDFETAQLPKEGDEAFKPPICEVGRTLIECDAEGGEFKITGSTSVLCDPGSPIAPEASAIHHIVDADVVGAKSPDAVLSRLTTGGPAYFVAHGADFEKSLFDSGEIPWIDTYKVALRIWPDAPAHKLQVLRYFLELKSEEYPIGAPHRAGPDSLVCALLMGRILETKKFTFAEMVRFSDGPALLPRIPFGMHRGKKWDEVPTSYLEWIVNKSDLDRDAKANAKYWLKQRAGQ